MSGWIKFDKDMADDPRLSTAAAGLCGLYVFARSPGLGGEDLSNGDALRLSRNALLGALLTLWKYADEHIRDDDTLPISSKTLDAIVGLDGFSGLMPTEWLVELDDGSVKLPGYCAKNRLIAKRKRTADNKARQARWRARQTESNGSGNAAHNDIVTRYSTVTKCVDQDQDQDKTLRSSSSGELSPSDSLRAAPGAIKNREDKRRAVATLVAAVSEEKRA